MQYDYIIIGQGLAGSCLAMQLLHEDKHIFVIDNPHPNTSSMIAAGIFNPITGRKMIKTWKADDLFSYLHTFYQQIEKELEVKFFHSINIYRPFLDMETQNEWMGKSTYKEHQNYIKNIYYNPQYSTDLFDEYGGLELKKSGYVDLPIFINSIKLKLKKDNLYGQEVFDESKLVLTDNMVTYKGLKSKRIIMCNGIEGASSKLFGWLPYSLVKGEILKISVTKSPKVIYNKGVFMLPEKNGNCCVGATYERNDLTNRATEKARKALVNKLNGLYRLDFNIMDQVAGVRPATLDRRPFIGTHPKYSQVGVFNGLGAKGVSLAPYFSKQFINMLEQNGELDAEVNINRYKSLYYDTID